MANLDADNSVATETALDSVVSGGESGLFAKMESTWVGSLTCLENKGDLSRSMVRCHYSPPVSDQLPKLALGSRLLTGGSRNGIVRSNRT